MPPFQSRLFRWIYHSPPFQWGRRARLALQRWLQELPRAVAHFWQDTIPRTDRAALPPWQKFLAQAPAKLIETGPNNLAQAPKALIPDRWRALLEEAINYFLRRPKISARQREYENESSHWPPLPPPQDQITEIDLEEPPLHAWIDTNATSLGYAYSPFINFLLWLDRQIASLEAWLAKLWRRFWRWLTRSA